MKAKRIRDNIQRRKLKCLLTSAKEAYKATGESFNTICGGKFKLVHDTKTLNFYLSTIKTAKPTVIIAVRGSVTLKDWMANVLTVGNMLHRSRRYRSDKKIIDRFMKKHPPKTHTYICTGHSLGGGIVSQLVRDFKFIKSTTQFNPSAQIKDMLSPNPKVNDRHYIDKDPLYRLNGWTFREATVYKYRKKRVDTFFAKLKDMFKPEITGPHKLSSFDPYFND